MQKILLASSKDIEFTEEAVKWIEKKYPDFFHGKDNLERCQSDILMLFAAEPNNNVLIECFESIGNKMTDWGHLQIVQIPDNIDWEIAYDYDGHEYVAERHRKWEWQRN